MADQAQKDSFLAALAEIGGSAGNGRLRDALGWDDATYDAVKQALIEEGAIATGRGRGGSISIANAEGVAPAAAQAAKVDRQVRAARPNTTAANVGYEAELWRMADALRGSMDAAEYKHVVLGLIFLKYISDAFEEMHAKLEAEEAQGADPEDPDEYRAQSIFWVPPEARWAHLKAQARQSTIGQIVDDAMAGIERDNPALKGVLPKDYARPALDKTRLGQLIDLISNIKVGDAEARAKDVLGRVYEYFLSQFASAEGKKGGEFYTPRCVVKLLVEMLEPYRGRVYDPCCGSSGMFVQSMEFIRAHANGNGNGGRIKADISIYGQESNYTTWRLAKMNLAIRGIDGQIAHGDTFHNDRHPDLRADFILANPPFNISDWGGDLAVGLRLAFDFRSRSSKRKFEPRHRFDPGKCWFIRPKSGGYRMAEVNSHGERRSSERDFAPTARAQGAQPFTKTAEFLGFSGPISRRRDCPHGQCWRRERNCRRTLSAAFSMTYELHRLRWMFWRILSLLR